jgi:hypothetical protein
MMQEMMCRKIAVLMAAAIAIGILVLPILACYIGPVTDYDEEYSAGVFYVQTYAEGCDMGSYFANYTHWWHHGATQTNPPYLYCSYKGHTWRTYEDDQLVTVGADAWGNITDKSGQQIDWIDASASVDAGNQ